MSSLKPIVHAGISGSVRDAIEAAIVQGELAPKTQLIDRQLAAELNVSRTPIREALRQLEPSGLVRRQIRGGVSGWVVAEFHERDVRELFELRRLLEPAGITRMGFEQDAGAAARLSTYFDAFEHTLGRSRYKAYIDRDRSFHKEIVKASKNSRVIHFYSIMEKQIDRIRNFLSIGYEGRMDSIVKEHEALCQAIAELDFEEAGIRLIHHLHQGEAAMIEFAHQRGLLAGENRTKEQPNDEV